FAFRTKGRCWLCDPIHRCPYFEQCVIPMGRSDWPGLKTAEEHKQFDEGILAYRRAVLILDASKRPCPLCKARHLEKRKRYCYECADRIRRENDAARKARRRGLSG